MRIVWRLERNVGFVVGGSAADRLDTILIA
jgi:hypothetical protein